MSRSEGLAVAAAGGILFISIGTRQGFGLFHAAVGADLALDRSGFARSIALQYLVWGLAGPAVALPLATRGPTAQPATIPHPSQEDLRR